jgi:hypothetical protein
MSRRVHRVTVELDAKGIRDLPFGEIKIILRGAEYLIMSGGRTMLAKILKGSQEKQLLKLKLDGNPAYGFYRDLSLAEITAKIDWMFLNGYFRIEYDYRLPLIVYSERGLEIEIETITDELFDKFSVMVNSGLTEHDMFFLKDINRRTILVLLDKIEERGDFRYIPLLRRWQEINYKKVQKRIQEVILTLAR